MGRVMQVLLAYAKYCLAKGVAGLVEPDSLSVLEGKERTYISFMASNSFVYLQVYDLKSGLKKKNGSIFGI